MSKVKMKAPKEVSSFNLRGEPCQIGADGCIEVDAQDVDAAQAHGFSVVVEQKQQAKK